MMIDTRRLFCPTPEEQEEDKKNIEKIIQKFKDDKHCRYCVNAEERPYKEMGYNSGTVTYCNILQEYRLAHPTGEQCPYWQLKTKD